MERNRNRKKKVEKDMENEKVIKISFKTYPGS